MHAKLGCLAALAAFAAASDVVDLKKDTFDEFITGNGLVLAECMNRLPCIPYATILLTVVPI